MKVCVGKEIFPLVHSFSDLSVTARPVVEMIIACRNSGIWARYSDDMVFRLLLLDMLDWMLHVNEKKCTET